MRVPSSSRQRRTTSLSLLAAACAATALTLATSARADDEPGDLDSRPYRLQRPTAIRLGGSILALPRDDENLVFANATVARQILERLALEGSAGGGGTQAHHGLQLGLAARGTILGNRRGGFTAELGMHAVFLGGLGTPLAFGHTGLAFELRTQSGFCFIAGGGVARVLSDSRRRASPCETDDQGCYRYRAGDLGLWANVQAGTSF